VTRASFTTHRAAPSRRFSVGTARTLRNLIANPFSRDELAYRIAVGDSLLFLAESEKPLEDIFGDSTGWHRAFMP
jgi:hypothetical protein